MPRASIWRRWMMPHSAQRATASRSSSLLHIPWLHKGQAPSKDKCSFFAYATNYLIDLDHAIIVDVEATHAIRQAEAAAAPTMIGRVEDGALAFIRRSWLKSNRRQRNTVVLRRRWTRSGFALFRRFVHYRLWVRRVR